MLVATRPTLSTETTPDGVEILTLDGDFELAHARGVGHRLTDLLGKCEGDLIVDLRGVSFLDSKMLRILLIALRHAAGLGCRLLLVRPNPHVWRVFEVGGFERIFTSCGDLHEALASLAERPGAVRV
jgi:anti-sigma B factor antagonist